MNIQKPILVTGATGYVGGRLVPRLLYHGYRVRAMGRSLAKLGCRPWASHPAVEMVEGDVLGQQSLTRAAFGCHAAFYLVHSMISRNERYAEADRHAAKNMVKAASAAGLKKIIYLGGLGHPGGKKLSKHLKSRHEVANILQSGPVPATCLRAAMILGSGSASFEILRYLADRLPVMITPRWVNTPCQPISIANVLNYLEGCLKKDETNGASFDICGPDILTYRELMDLYAEIEGLSKRIIIPVPMLTPGLSAKWIHLVTPVPSAIAVPLTEGLSTPVICQENRIALIIPQKLYTCRETIERALEKVRQEMVETCWTDAGAVLPPEWARCGDAGYAGGTILECGYKVRVRCTPEALWKPLSRIGGKTGWYFADKLWRIRGIMDKLAGGPGLRRGRRNPEKLQIGDALDFFRVIDVNPPNRLVLQTEMKLPGEALADFRLNSSGSGETELILLSRFLPKGIGGIIYWFTFLPFHEFIFFGMLKNIAKASKKDIIGKPERFKPRVKPGCFMSPKNFWNRH
jgi:uncharacterized protein YbjT (DUF2867 family)